MYPAEKGTLSTARPVSTCIHFLAHPPRLPLCILKTDGLLLQPVPRRESQTISLDPKNQPGCVRARMIGIQIL
ncbi:hypothetical protein M406DRAFT_54048 [Cryphonectria parasitica EP155]|uniref:Uncharacterized protein n=1 Tax=Cryphonectria parasitica (strain ATCC 38755 / EP155) TaxID=660469 RepID=A0A9P4YDW6_CRYP1|nr:uncharacterized protein M406DRAFT_54048 [Cryphonectria parasitica EP155]KAF3770805.1 hypothetical protein M406DRAFT_54048 [Cryphonectria parasitica EP155]